MISICSATSLLGETQWHRSRLDKLCDPAVQRGVREGLPQQSRRGNLTLSQVVLKANSKPISLGLVELEQAWRGNSGGDGGWVSPLSTRSGQSHSDDSQLGEDQVHPLS